MDVNRDGSHAVIRRPEHEIPLRYGRETRGRRAQDPRRAVELQTQANVVVGGATRHDVHLALRASATTSGRTWLQASRGASGLDVLVHDGSQNIVRRRAPAADRRVCPGVAVPSVGDTTGTCLRAIAVRTRTRSEHPSCRRCSWSARFPADSLWPTPCQRPQRSP